MLCSSRIGGRYLLRCNVCLVDSLNFTKVLPYLPAAKTQVACADGIVMNKSELLDPSGLERLESLLRQLNSRAPIAFASHGRVDGEFLQSLEPQPPGSVARTQPPREIVTWSTNCPRVSRSHLVKAIEQLGERLLRLKGIVDLGQGPRLVESVFGSFTQNPLSSSSQRPGMTAIGWKITREELGATLAAACRTASQHGL